MISTLLIQSPITTRASAQRRDSLIFWHKTQKESILSFFVFTISEKLETLSRVISALLSLEYQKQRSALCLHSPCTHHHFCSLFNRRNRSHTLWLLRLSIQLTGSLYHNWDRFKLRDLFDHRFYHFHEIHF